VEKIIPKPASIVDITTTTTINQQQQQHLTSSLVRMTEAGCISIDEKMDNRTKKTKKTLLVFDFDHTIINE